ncbi:hypothetical protein M0R45_006782 [Rubus argutus]
MKAPIPGVPLKIYLAATDAAIGSLLAQDDGNGIEHPVYYVSRLLGEAESRYPSTERVCLALIYAAQRWRHYFLAHKLHLMVKTNEETSLMQDIPGGLQEMVGVLTDNELKSKQLWTLFFDGSTTSNGGGALMRIMNN